MFQKTILNFGCLEMALWGAASPLAADRGQTCDKLSCVCVWCVCVCVCVCVCACVWASPLAADRGGTLSGPPAA